MIEILEMQEKEVEEVLARVNYGHFGCSLNDQPYVVPINYAYEQPYIFIYTTAGLKSEILKENPLICLQVEEFDDNGWRSVVVTGTAEPIVDSEEREKAVTIIRSTNPSLLPALALKWKNDWVRKNVEMVYRIEITKKTGLQSSEIQMAAASAHPVAAASDPRSA